MGWVIGFASITQSPGGRSTADGRADGRGGRGACAPRHSGLAGGLVLEPAAGSREAFDPADHLPAEPARADVQDGLPVLPQRCAALRIRGPAVGRALHGLPQDRGGGAAGGEEARGLLRAGGADPVDPREQAPGVHLLPAQGTPARKREVPDVPRTRRGDDDVRRRDRPAPDERPAEPRGAPAGRAAAHDGLVPRLPPAAERDGGRTRAARLRHVPPLSRAEPGVPRTRTLERTEPDVPVTRHPRSDERTEPDVPVTRPPRPDERTEPDVPVTRHPRPDARTVPDVPGTRHPRSDERTEPDVPVTRHPRPDERREPDVPVTRHPRPDERTPPDAPPTRPPRPDARW